MTQLLPSSFLFRFSLACRYRKTMPRTGDGDLLGLGREYRLPYLGAMDHRPETADIRMAWNEKGLGLQWGVTAKQRPLYGEPDRPTACDSLSVWLDLRDTRTVHRATRFCRRFTLLAHDGSTEGQPAVLTRSIHRALEDAPAIDTTCVRIRRHALDEDGDALPEDPRGGVQNYRMEVFFPEAALPGYEPETCSRLGVFYRLRDQELGDQLLCAASEFPYWEDPSLWATLELTR